MLVMVACSAASTSPSTVDQAAPDPTVITTSTTVVVGTTFDPGDLADWEPVTVLLGEQELTVALADEEAERQEGLQGVSEFGGFDGMLFAWDEEVTTGFWMKEVPAALDILFFDASGALLDQTTMEPCSADPCRVFVADGLFRWVLELPAGALSSLSVTDQLVLP